MDRRRFVHAAGAGVVLGWLAGCTGTWLRPLKPEVALADVRFEGGNLLEQRFVLTLRVTNPNRFEIPMQGLTFTLDVADQPFAHGMGNRPVTIPALGEALVEVKATTGLVSFLSQFGKLGKTPGAIPYRLKGRLVTGGRFGDLDFDRRGEMDPAKLLKGGRAATPPAEQF